ncbi:mandelate racemase/muconate lactonizing enzyme family protein [Gaiella sp.]|uniref:mandelate racemase/muconate lactonizing enzyme family protein n=1 Tax=Gaiella sp. TaxID=2663207 RepID=UPI00398343F5
MMSRIRVIRVGTATLPLPAPLRLGQMTIQEREYAAVEVETDDGIIGKAYCLTRNGPVAACVERLIAPVIVGRQPDAEALWDDCSRANVAVGRTGLVVKALGLVDVALWDIAAQVAGVPLWQHLGASTPTAPVMMVAAYPIAGRDPESLAEDVIRYARAGYGLLKIARDPDPARMRRLLEHAAAGLPDGARLVVDGGYVWRSSDEALAEVALWGATPLAWLEDPLVPEDAEGCAAIRRLGPYPVGVGDEVSHIGTFRALLDADALDVLRLDVLAIGGVTPARRAQALAVEHNVPVSFHVYPEVSIHLATCTPGSLVETFDPDLPGGNPLDPAHRLSTGGPAFVEGMAVARDGPGLGFDLDWSLFLR